MEELYRRGVRNFVVEADGATGGGETAGMTAATVVGGGMTDANIILVRDSLAALQQLAGSHRRQFAIPVIGITGSNGKTIVKEWLNQLLEDEYHIVRSPKSYNSQTGVPLSVWELQTGQGLAIFEGGVVPRGGGVEGGGGRGGGRWGFFVVGEGFFSCKDQRERVGGGMGWIRGGGGMGHRFFLAWGNGPGVWWRTETLEKKEGQTTIRGSYS